MTKQEVEKRLESALKQLEGLKACRTERRDNNG